jgi:hypothetical protein
VIGCGKKKNYLTYVQSVHGCGKTLWEKARRRQGEKVDKNKNKKNEM